MSNSTEHYYYLHTNGDLIHKNPIATSVNDLDESPFVKRWWIVNTRFRETAWNMVLEALTLGANLNRIKGLAEKWKMTFEDSLNYIVRVKPDDTLRRGLAMFAELVFNMTADEYFEKVTSPPEGTPIRSGGTVEMEKDNND